MRHHNFYISDINGRFNALLKQEDYNMLKNCNSLEEIVVKLNQHFSFINEDMGYDDLREKFVKNVMNEINEFRCKELKYFEEYYMICNFFNKLDGVKEHVIGFFPELKALDLCNNFEDVRKMCINNCFLLKYFKKINEFEKQKTMLVVLKLFMDEMYEKSDAYFKEILQHEGDRQILEICLSGASLKDKKQYFPNATTLSGSDLEKLGETNDLEEIAQIFNFGGQPPVESIVQKLSSVYANSFNQFEDTACIYAYFKLKEQEIENIMWIVNCLLQNAPEKMNEIIVFDN